MRYWIRDRKLTPQLRPLYELVARVRQALEPTGCQLAVMSARTYGSRLRDWEELVSRDTPLPVSFDLLLEMSRRAEREQEWFYDLDVECIGPNTKVRFGLLDRSALFLEAPPQQARQILDGFHDIHPDPDNIVATTPKGMCPRCWWPGRHARERGTREPYASATPDSAAS
jgi:hypothetical protein